MQTAAEVLRPGDDGGRSTADALFRRCQQPVTLKFDDVGYKIRCKAPPASGPGKTSERAILEGVSGVVRPGEMLAMLGPSGSGKTTLITALGGRLPGGGGVTGSIAYNGGRFSSAVKRRMGFVTQDDVLYPHLTVAETLFYTAVLRLPRALTRREKAAAAAAVAAQLGLRGCRDSVVGGPGIRGISGGERKRVSIGQEMLVNPSLIFLDEPTSGLDSTTAQRILASLGELAAAGRTVVMTIHQPSSRLFYMFHKVLLLSQGSPLYFGQASAAMAHFSAAGYSPSVAMNPADFLLDLANGVSPDGTAGNAQALRQALLSAYAGNIREQLKKEIREQEDHRPSKITAGSSSSSDGSTTHDYRPQHSPGTWATTWWEQFTVLLRRGMKERRHEAFSFLKMAQIVLTTLLAGALWWQSTGRIQDQVGLVFFMISFVGFFPLFEAIFTFPQERAMLEKERASGMYRLSSYFMARSVGDLPVELALPALLVTAVYWMGGLDPRPAAFFQTLAVLLLGVLVSQGLGLALGVLVMDLKTASTVASVLMLTFMLAGGFFVQRVPPFVVWIKYTSLVYYLFKAALGLQFSAAQTYPCGPRQRCSLADFPAIRAVGLRGSTASSVGMLLVLLLLFRLVAYAGLTRIGTTRRR